ncbi:MAG: hypothetical protein QOG30_3227 [Acidimicrobiaceae bacterium]|jgi:hypothetical protein
MWLPWQPALFLSVVVGVFGFAMRRATTPRLAFAQAFSQELSLVLVLYSIWQFVATLGSVREADGFANGRAVYDLERTLHIANEASVVRWFLPHPLWVQFWNGYYAIAHAPALIIFLVWLFVRHRDRYPRVRNTVALVTGICLTLHFVPLAPPRLYPELGFVDTAKEYGQSVYGTIGHGLSDQMSAMPSMHVAWALIVGIGTITISTSRWRWLVLVHTALTVLAVTATANHWWLDGVAAAAILAVVVAWQRLLATIGAMWRTRRATVLVPAAAD